MTTKAASYTRAAISLHWVIALLIFVAFPLGLYMHNLLATPYKLRLFNYHKWIGISVLTLSIIRIVWRIFNRPPDLPATMASWEKSVAVAMQVLLYALLFAVPLTGWLMSSASGFQTVLFGAIPIPDLVGKDKELARFLLELHRNLDYLLIALVGVHITAALKHHFLVHDDVLRQMIPFRGKSGM